MLAQKLRVEDVLALEHQMLSDIDLWEHEGKGAEKMLAYIDGAHFAFETVIEAIKEREES